MTKKLNDADLKKLNRNFRRRSSGVAKIGVADHIKDFDRRIGNVEMESPEPDIPEPASEIAPSPKPFNPYSPVIVALSDCLLVAEWCENGELVTPEGTFLRPYYRTEMGDILEADYRRAKQRVLAAKLDSDARDRMDADKGAKAEAKVQCEEAAKPDPAPTPIDEGETREVVTTVSPDMRYEGEVRGEVDLGDTFVGATLYKYASENRVAYLEEYAHLIETAARVARSPNLLPEATTADGIAELERYLGEWFERMPPDYSLPQLVIEKVLEAAADRGCISDGAASEALQRMREPYAKGINKAVSTVNNRKTKLMSG